jgi:hypothetical protein
MQAKKADMRWSGHLGPMVTKNADLLEHIHLLFIQFK